MMVNKPSCQGDLFQDGVQRYSSLKWCWPTSTILHAVMLVGPSACARSNSSCTLNTSRSSEPLNQKHLFYFVTFYQHKSFHFNQIVRICHKSKVDLMMNRSHLSCLLTSTLQEAFHQLQTSPPCLVFIKSLHMSALINEKLLKFRHFSPVQFVLTLFCS